MLAELDWDSLDSGRLHWTASRAKTLAGQRVVVGVLSDFSKFEEVLIRGGYSRNERAESGRNEPV